MSRKITGMSPLAYLGVQAPEPPNMVVERRAPTANDYQEFNLGDIWLDISRLSLVPPQAPTSKNIWMLVSKNKRIANATWVSMDSETLTGDIGGAVGSDIVSNINLLGTAGHIITTGNPAANTITWDLDAAIADTYTADIGAAVPVANNLNLQGGILIDTNAVGDTVIFDANGAVAGAFTTDLGIAVPALNNINILTDNIILNCGSSVLFSASAADTVRLNVTDVNRNTLIGIDSGNLAITGTDNIGLGSTSLNQLTTGDHNIGIGVGALTACTTGFDNTAVGYNALLDIVTASGNTAIGALTLDACTGNNNTAIGTEALTRVTTGTYNVALGYLTAVDLTTGSHNISIGSTSLPDLLTGNNNIVIGDSAGGSYTGAESANTLIGHLGVVGQSNFIGIAAGSGGNLMFHNYGTENTFVGLNSGNLTLTVASAIYNTGLGTNTLQGLTTGTSNCAFGETSLISCTTGNNNNAFGVNSSIALTTGSYNLSIGTDTLRNLVTGSYNVSFGYDTGSALAAAESSNILISHTGIIGDNNTIRIGTVGGGAGQQNQCYVAGISGVVVVGAGVLVSAVGQLGVAASSIKYKQNIEDMGYKSEVIYNLRPVTFNYKQYPNDPAWGLIAEEVVNVCPQLILNDAQGEPQTVKYHELPVLLLNELQKLRKEFDEYKLKHSFKEL